MTNKQFIEIVEWQKQTFGQATALSKIEHLKEEMQELIVDLKSNSQEKRLEFADCFFLLFGAAAADGMSYEDICNAIQSKFEINKARQWGKPDQNGVVKHIQQSSFEHSTEHKIMNKLPRRFSIDNNSRVELAIRNAVKEIEHLPADTRLSDAVIKLEEARDLVADFIDEHQYYAFAYPPPPPADRVIKEGKEPPIPNSMV